MEQVTEGIAPTIGNRRVETACPRTDGVSSNAPTGLADMTESGTEAAPKESLTGTETSGQIGSESVVAPLGAAAVFVEPPKPVSRLLLLPSTLLTSNNASTVRSSDSEAESSPFRNDVYC
ncbi:unnamed protein product [Dicrocoelium dendriticum]|nr:unnamed protein product [Dicrocoelium dendriticum]